MTAATDRSAAIEVVAGGEPTAEQLAALAVALTPVEVTDVPTSTQSPWLRAALLEGVGARPATCSTDVGRT